MGKIIVIASQKGGVGKTTTALNFGYELSRQGERVLLLDLDPQGGLSLATNIRKRSEAGFYDFLQRRVDFKSSAFRSSQKNLAVMGIGDSRPEAIFALETLAGKGTVGKCLQHIAKSFDYVIVDAPAGVNTLSMALLRVADEVLIALQCAALSLKSLPKMLSLIDWVKKDANAGLTLRGILLTMLKPDDETAAALYREVTDGFPPETFFNSVINYDPVFEQASLKALPVTMLRDGIQAGRDYYDLVQEFKARERRSESKEERDEFTTGLF